MTPALELVDAGLRYGERAVWTDLSLRVSPGEFLTVLGPNGSGKSSLLSVILGLRPLTNGHVLVGGLPTRRGSTRIGYVPQHQGYAVDTPMRGQDLVELGIDGNRWGLPAPGRHRRLVAELLADVDATHLARRPLGRMSGGEHQRLRIAQALATDPRVLLCDEPLLSLDLRHQRRVVQLLDRRRREGGTAVVFVTHEINPVLGVTDNVLYLAEGNHRLGRPDQVMTSESLTALYGTPVDVIRRGDQLAILGLDAAPVGGHEHPHGSSHAVRT
jgi:zinc/manganese transport system ATP-binding protein